MHGIIRTYSREAFDYYATKIERDVSRSLPSLSQDRTAWVRNFNCDPCLFHRKTHFAAALENPALRGALADKTRDAYQRRGYQVEVCIQHSWKLARNGETRDGIVGTGYELLATVKALPAGRSPALGTVRA